MLRDIFTNKWILAAVSFLMLLSVACVFWYQHDIAPAKQEAAETAKLVREWEIANAKTGSAAETTSSQVFAESTPSTAAEPTHPIGNETADAMPTVVAAQDKQTASSTNEVVEVAVRTSPFGFGAYPTIPAVYRDLDGVQDIWAVYEEMAETNPELARMNELGERVLIKLWEQGLQPTGGTHSNGQFYPNYPNTVYVTWTEEVLEDGTVDRYPTAVRGDPAFSAYEAEFIESDGEVFPSGWTMLDKQQDGIDPYQFLNLP